VDILYKACLLPEEWFEEVAEQVFELKTIWAGTTNPMTIRGVKNWCPLRSREAGEASG